MPQLNEARAGAGIKKVTIQVAKHLVPQEQLNKRLEVLLEQSDDATYVTITPSEAGHCRWNPDCRLKDTYTISLSRHHLNTVLKGLLFGFTETVAVNNLGPQGLQLHLPKRLHALKDTGLGRKVMGRGVKNKQASVAMDSKLIVQLPTNVAPVWQGKVGASIARIEDGRVQVRLFRQVNAPSTWEFNSKRACPEARIPKGTIEFAEAELRTLQFTYTHPVEVTLQGEEIVMIMPAHLAPPRWLAKRGAVTQEATPVHTDPAPTQPVNIEPTALLSDPLQYHLRGLKAVLASDPTARIGFLDGELVVYRSFE